MNCYENRNIQIAATSISKARLGATHKHSVQSRQNQTSRFWVDSVKLCQHCSKANLTKYRKRISGPLLDRIEQSRKDTTLAPGASAGESTKAGSIKGIIRANSRNSWLKFARKGIQHRLCGISKHFLRRSWPASDAFPPPEPERAQAKQNDGKIQQCTQEPRDERKAKEGDHRDRKDHANDHRPEAVFGQR